MAPAESHSQSASSEAEAAMVASFCKILSLTLSKRDWYLDKAHLSKKILLELKGRTRFMRPLQALVASKVRKMLLYEIRTVYVVIVPKTISLTGVRRDG